MLHAVLHGKLDPTSPEPQRLEDALTSAAFGTLILVEAWDLLDAWLLREQPAASQATRDCWFWPRLDGGVQPDVVLRLGATVLVVEAKYRSGRHDRPSDDIDEGQPVDQIERQYLAVSSLRNRRSPHPDALELAVRECELSQAFLVDARKMRHARREYDESRERLPNGAKDNFVLRTWQELYDLLLRPEWSRRRWAADLRTYLESCGLASFYGIGRDLANGRQIEGLSDWRPVSIRSATPTFETAAALLGTLTLGDLRHWRPLVGRLEAPKFRAAAVLLSDPAIQNLRHWHS